MEDDKLSAIIIMVPNGFDVYSEMGRFICKHHSYSKASEAAASRGYTVVPKTWRVGKLILDKLEAKGII